MEAWLIGNTLVALSVVLLLFAFARPLRSRPALGHLLWVLAFVVLVMPPLPIEGSPGAKLRDAASSWWVGDAQPAVPAPTMI